ncbi:probable cytochrome P450 305a1 [Manduca sexta]|uniref:Cytochrome P450 n=1 Tax=Manduca sexta TaxID=7130 RepID=A0A921ZA23_MANSE|nr:probable cytochrome P450 305a1 [Manduca sexta]KAG6454181.1 hypothetical protein O3G_MSEX008549 [Manduca sexta]KAG6454182.1 hypothetical protein O3G_MSEX008549 [Manduca sexta]KAG6454183.1 hypothetical protein O3G_MSEX008549 [Manduca sexta]
MFAILVATLLVFFVGYIIKSIIKPRNFPPGPRWYPFIGSSNVVQSMTKKHGSQFKALLELSKEYSTNVLGLKLGREVVVAVYGERNVRQIFTEKAFEGRPDNFFIRLRCLGKRLGITFADGPQWRIQRQFTVKQLRNVGFGKTPMEKEIQKELQNVISYIDANRHEPITPKSIFSVPVMNVLWKYVAGEKIQQEKLTRLLELFSVRSKAFVVAGGLLNQIPWCRFFIPRISGYQLIADLNQQISEIIEEAIEKHKNKEIQVDDFIYMYLKEMQDNKDTFTYDQLTIICLDMIIAGAQTTGNSLEFAILAALRNRNIQERMIEEIDKNIGDEPPSYTDSAKLVYTSAFLQEVHRMYTIAPVAGPRRALEDTIVDGYLIPKDATVLISVGDIHRDPELWQDPNEFNPERFIDERGILKNSEHMYPFGLGRRRCPGDALAKSAIFILFVGILQKYRISPCNGVLPSDEAQIGIIAGAKPYKAIFSPRK